MNTKSMSINELIREIIGATQQSERAYNLQYVSGMITTEEYNKTEQECASKMAEVIAEIKSRCGEQTSGTPFADILK